MAGNLPQWADARASNDLPKRREQGEGQELEFKADFPPQAHDLAQEMAAFASSGAGTILIGVSDDGSLSGLRWDSSTRDAAVQRAHGIARSVRPDMKVTFVFAIENAQPVLCIQIPKQEEPVYYYDGRPYIRDGQVSRRATPEEVKQLVWKHPSSEHKRKMEELNYQQDADFVEDSRRRRKEHDEAMRRSREQHDQNMANMYRRLYRG